MSINSSAPAVGQYRASSCRCQQLGATLKRWWLAYMMWRLRWVAITHLSRMTDRELNDFGLTRSDVTAAVAGHAASRHARGFRIGHARRKAAVS